MYLGKFVEGGSVNDVFYNPSHPYSKALLSARPTFDPTSRIDRIILKGDVPSPINPPEGCKFQKRCKYAKDICREKAPELREVRPGHFVACHLVD